MTLKKNAGIVPGMMLKLGISTRLVVTLMLYTAISLFLMIALFAAPWLVITGTVLAALVFDCRKTARRREAEHADAAQNQTGCKLP